MINLCYILANLDSKCTLVKSAWACYVDLILKKHLVSRGHSARAVHQAIKKVKSMPRLSVLSEKPATRDCVNIWRFLLLSPAIPLYPPYVRLPVLTTISSTPQIASNVQSVRSLWLFSDTLLAWGTSLSELRSRPLMTVPFLPSSTECLGALLDVNSTGADHKIRGHITCTTSNIIYLIYRICGIQYIGETKKSLKKRFCGHRSSKNLWANTSIYLITPFLTWSCRHWGAC